MKIIIHEDSKKSEILNALTSLVITQTNSGKTQFRCDAKAGFRELMEMLFTVQLHIMNRFAKNEQAREEIYDYYNVMASSVLQSFIPDNQRKDLTAEAIMEIENQILDLAYEESKKQKDEEN